MLTFIAVGGLATSIQSCCPWLTGGWPRQFFGRHNMWKGGRGKSTNAKGCAYSLIGWNGSFNAKKGNESCKFSFSSALGRQWPLCVALSGSICGSLCSSLWLVLCDILSGSFWTALVLSGSLSGSLTFSCSPWLALALIFFGGPCFAFRPQSCVAWNLPSLI